VNIGAIVKRAQKATADNAPTILTALGVTGLVTTAVLTGKASFKAGKIIHERNESTKNSLGDLSHEINMTSREMAELTWKLYIPAAATGAVTIACIVSANHISTRRTAALASAYSITQEAFREYREKIVEKVGEKKEQQARDEIAQESVSKNPPPSTLIIADDKVLCKDLYSGRYFQSTLEDIKAAVNYINFQINNDNYASLTDFWERIGLEKTSDSDEIGWNNDGLLEVLFGSALTAKNTPCVTVEFRTEPIRKFYRSFR
jgi:hypothetical protein